MVSVGMRGLSVKGDGKMSDRGKSKKVIILNVLLMILIYL
jgi:hypothetical protein